MNDPLITVIIPVYKVEQYLEKCVKSILSQTYANLEVFLVDDGSPDRCGEICDNFAEQDSRVKVIHKANGGLSDARNVAIESMKGDFVTFVDSDDFVAENYVEYLYGLIKEYNAQISTIAWQEFLEGSEPCVDSPSQHNVTVLSSEEALSAMFYQKKFDNAACLKMYKASLFSDVRYPIGLLFEDVATTYKLIMKAEKVVCSDYKAYYYLLRKDSIEGSVYNPKKYDSCVQIVHQLNSDRNQMSGKVQKALNSRLVSFIFHILMIVPKNEVQVRRELFKMIKQNRDGIVFDNNARKKTRVASLLSYGGLGLFDLFAKYGSYRRKG